MDDEHKRQEIQEIFSEAQKLTSPENRATSDIGMEVSPVSQEPERYAIGNYAHEHAEKFISGLPEGLDRERTIQDNGKTHRPDRVDWENAKVWEIKPETTNESLLKEHAQQAKRYEDAMNRQFPEYGNWQGELGLYDPVVVRQDMVDKGLLAPTEHDTSFIRSESEQATREAMRDFYNEQSSDRQEKANDQIEPNEPKRG